MWHALKVLADAVRRDGRDMKSSARAREPAQSNNSLQFELTQLSLKKL